MPCDKHQKQVDAYLNQQLSKKEANRLITLLQQQGCNTCLETIEACDALEGLSDNWQELPTPEWPRAHHCIAKQPKSTHWLNHLSLATSALALVLVLFRVEIHSTPEGTLVSFAGQQALEQQSDVTQQVRSAFAELQQQQSDYLDTKLTNFANNQHQQNLQLMKTIVEINRSERKQDLTQLVGYWKADIADYRFQERVEDALSTRKINSNTLPPLYEQDSTEPSNTNKPDAEPSKTNGGVVE